MSKNGSALKEAPGTALSVIPFTDGTVPEVHAAIERTLKIGPVIREIEADVTKLQREVDVLQVTNDAEQANADALRGRILAVIGRTEAHDAAYAKPWNRLWRLVKSGFTPSANLLDDMKKKVSNLMAGYQDVKEDRANAAAAEQQKAINLVHTRQVKAADKKGVAAPPPPIQVQSSVPKQVGGTSFVKVWSFSLTDEGKSVPREYLMVDMQKIRTAVTGGARNPDIAGVDIREKTQPRG